MDVDKTVEVLNPKKYLEKDLSPRNNVFGFSKDFKPISFKYYDNLYVTLGKKVIKPTNTKAGFSFLAVSFTRETSTGKLFTGLDISINAMEHLIKALLILQEKIFELKEAGTI